MAQNLWEDMGNLISKKTWKSQKSISKDIKTWLEILAFAEENKLRSHIVQVWAWTQLKNQSCYKRFELAHLTFSFAHFSSSKIVSEKICSFWHKHREIYRRRGNIFMLITWKRNCPARRNLINIYWLVYWRSNWETNKSKLIWLWCNREHLAYFSAEHFIRNWNIKNSSLLPLNSERENIEEKEISTN